MTIRAAPTSARTDVRALLNERSTADALASYYAFYHAADRTELFVAEEGGRSRGFLVRARTGLDLFRPLVTYRAPDEGAAVALFEAGLIPGRPVYLTVPEAQAPWANKHLVMSDVELHRILRLNPERHQPLINVLVMTSTGADGLPRCEIRAGNRAGAVAGLNWQSPKFAELYVYTEPAVRGRGWGKSVVSALVQRILQSGRVPLYVAAESNEYSLRLAEAVGFEDTGHREFVGQAVRLPSPDPA